MQQEKEMTPNIVVSMPSQLFTLARKFQAASNGKIYIGKIDTDPTIPENQIQVYLENEDGSTIPVAQPLIINQAGYPVYNGQIAKFVTVEGHSMAVYDSCGAQQFYYPNVLKYDPDQFEQRFRSELKSIDGAGMIGTESGGTVQESIDNINRNYVSNVIQPHAFVGGGNKLIIKTGIANTPLMVVTERAYGGMGYEGSAYVGMGLTNAVADSDSENYGGESIFRLGETWSIESAYTGKFKLYGKSDGVKITEHSESVMERFIGIKNYLKSDRIISHSSDGDVNFSKRKTWELPKNESVTFSCMRKCTVRLGVSNFSSESCTIETKSLNYASSTWKKYKDVSLIKSDGGISYADITVSHDYESEPFLLRVTNTTSGSEYGRVVYVIGVNILKMEDVDVSDNYDYDSVIVIKNGPIVELRADNHMYIFGSGANEFAAKDSSGKWFGTYHGGHSSLLQRLVVYNGTHNIDKNTDAVPAYILTNECSIKSNSMLTAGGSSYTFDATYKFGKGSCSSEYSVNLRSGLGADCITQFTHMCCSSRALSNIRHPERVDLTTRSGNVQLGNVGMITQCQFSSGGRTIDSSFTIVNSDKNSLSGAYIATYSEGYYKQYYGPLFDSSGKLVVGTFITSKTFS
ncbi:phage head-binding domain-containing protein [Providencia alcalifaciens]|uniref:phage head-binding domain-containing protein n=1 Tax=Providencia alcalifaciens TaxID=126385 RepID=UPI001E2C6B33|nr:phage head-binding domain-containing protein [Providencia alcalifaciens]